MSNLPVPSLPPGMDGFMVRKVGGDETYAVSYRDASKLAGVTEPTVRRWVELGTVLTCVHPIEGVLVLVDSLWAALPDEVKA